MIHFLWLNEKKQLLLQRAKIIPRCQLKFKILQNYSVLKKH